MKTLISTLATILLFSGSAIASTSARVDHSGFIVWAFLGLCGMIVVTQAIPAILLLLGVTKGIYSPKEEAK